MGTAKCRGCWNRRNWRMVAPTALITILLFAVLLQDNCNAWIPTTISTTTTTRTTTASSFWTTKKHSPTPRLGNISLRSASSSSSNHQDPQQQQHVTMEQQQHTQSQSHSQPHQPPPPPPPPLVIPAKSSAALDQYRQEHAYSIAHPDEYWGPLAKKLLHWDQPFCHVQSGSLLHGDVTWFAGGKLNVCYNAVDRHVFASSSTTTNNNNKANQVAMIWEGDEPHDIRKFTFAEVLRLTSQIANALTSQGVRRGDVVTIYMPMVPELPLTMLACARIGAIHSVVFAGFSAEALAQRIAAAKSKVLVTADVSVRAGKRIKLKETIVNDALEKLHALNHLWEVDKVLVWERFFTEDMRREAESDPTAGLVTYQPHHRDVRMNLLVAKQRPYSVPASMDAEDPLFILYTSGSTGQPKGLVHTTGGYAVYAAHTTATTFALCPDSDVFACVADCGWITGHTYVVYGPLLNGATTLIFESTPLYPTPGRYWDMIQRHGITQFYTAPTAIRSLMRHGDDIPKQYHAGMSKSLKVLGSVGEPINPEAWRWYYEMVGQEQCTVVDTYWQTETGGHVLTNLPGIMPMKPGSCALPFYGIDAVVLDARTGQIITQESALSSSSSVEGVLAIRQPWPGMARTCWGDHDRYMSIYLRPYPGFYFTGDSVRRDYTDTDNDNNNDTDGYYYITGRVDDVINVSGHRIGTAEVEAALAAHPAVAQAAVVGQPHPIKGQSIAAFVTLKQQQQQQHVNDEDKDDDENDTARMAVLKQELWQQVRTEIGPFASPDVICITPLLPMTRSGKIMRRILRKLVAGDYDSLGDVSTLADPSVVETLQNKLMALQQQQQQKQQQEEEDKQATATTTTTGATTR